LASIGFAAGLPLLTEASLVQEQPALISSSFDIAPREFRGTPTSIMHVDETEDPGRHETLGNCWPNLTIRKWRPVGPNVTAGPQPRDGAGGVTRLKMFEYGGPIRSFAPAVGRGQRQHDCKRPPANPI